MRGPLVILVSMFIAMPLFPASLDELIGTERVRAIQGSVSPLVEVQLKNPRPVLLPGHREIQNLVRNVQQDLQPSIMVETLFLFQKPNTRGPNEESGWNETEKTGLFNQALALSTLAGVQYYSASRNSMRTFYEVSHVIDGPDTKKIVSDPAYAVIPQSLVLYARQKDLTFGDNIYRYEYHSFSDAFFFVQENLTTLFAGIIPVVGKNKLRSVMAILDCGDSLLIYAVSMAKAVSLPGMGERAGSSFSNRAEAVLKWFMEKAGAVYNL